MDAEAQPASDDPTPTTQQGPSAQQTPAAQQAPATPPAPPTAGEPQTTPSSSQPDEQPKPNEPKADVPLPTVSVEASRPTRYQRRCQLTSRYGSTWSRSSSR